VDTEYQMLTLPEKVRRKKQSYIFIRSRLARRNLRKQATLFFGELREFIAARGISDCGPAFMRYLALENGGEMDVEFGFFTDRVHPGGGPVRAGILPSGSFMSTRWTGPFERLGEVNAMLSGWGDHNAIDWDLAETPNGVAYGCRMEIYHVTSRDVRSSDEFQTEIAMMLRPAAETHVVPGVVQLGLGKAPSFSHLPMGNWRNE
jgi:hypothetical protein